MDKVMVNKKKITLSPFLLVLLSFVIVILLGALFLSTPWANVNGQWNNFVDSLFIATSATCVTGLCSLPLGTAATYTFFGEFVVLTCIQIGGLGFITIMAFIVTSFKRKIQFKDRFFLTLATGSLTMRDLVKFVRRIVLISFTFEILGTLAYLPVFYTVFDNFWVVLWNSLFHSVSMFNNAGFDLLGTSSFMNVPGSIIERMPEWAYNYLSIETMILIVSGGLSFLTHIDLMRFKKPGHWKTFTKITVLMTTTLVLSGWLLFYLLEGFKPVELDPMTPLEALFQSITLRTAGAQTYDQNHLTVAGRVISCLLMFIGGNPLSTAGGVKTTTLFIILLSIFSYLKGSNVKAFKRSFSQKVVLKGMALTFLAFVAILITFLSVVGFEAGNPATEDEFGLLYEVFSAFGTVGVSTGVTSSLTVGSKIMLVLLMFTGRLGPMTFFQIFQKNMYQEENLHYKNVEEDIIIG